MPTPDDDDLVDAHPGDLEAGHRVAVGERRAGAGPWPAAPWWAATVVAGTTRGGRGRAVVATVVVGATVVASCSSNFRSRSLWARACSMPVPHSW